MTNHSIYAQYDLESLGILPSNWNEQIRNVCDEQAMLTVLDGRSVTSREPDGIKPIEVYVVTGSIVKQHLSWLHDLYRGHFRILASDFMKSNMVISDDLESGININVLRGKGSRYEWHVDTNPLTGLLFVTTHETGDGGELVFRVKDEEMRVHPRSGMLLTFDAREIPHTVMPLTGSSLRISIPMNYYFDGKIQSRPDDLSGYLYNPATS